MSLDLSISKININRYYSLSLLEKGTGICCNNLFLTVLVYIFILVLLRGPGFAGLTHSKGFVKVNLYPPGSPLKKKIIVTLE
jgi:hypothetical protein